MEKYRRYFIDKIKNNTLPHAVLFTGPAGEDQLKFSESLAQLVLCLSLFVLPTLVGESGSRFEGLGCLCKSCELFNSRTHPDYYLVSPEEKSKIITIEQIRHLSNALMHTAQLNHYQVAIINLAHAMNAAASNALLKTLEEPPGPVMIILISEKLHILPPTIYSRCQVFNLSSGISISEKLPSSDNKCYAAFLSKNYDPIDLAKYCLDFPVETVVEDLMDIVTSLIKKNPNLNLIQSYFNCYDRLLEIKKLIDNNINFNAQAMLEYVLIEWREDA